MNHKDAQVVDVDFCEFGTARKTHQTCLWFLFVLMISRDLTSDANAVDGLCSKSGKPHFHLTGTGPGGICWTRIAQTYPHGLAKALSH